MKENSIPDRVTINWVATCSGMHANTVRKRLTGMESDRNGKFDRATALQRLYVGEDGAMTYSDVQKKLSMEKTKQIQLQNDVIRKTRIPLDLVLAAFDETHQAMAATLRGSVGKVLTIELFNEIFASFREIPSRLKW
jgi:hypothetical protein